MIWLSCLLAPPLLIEVLVLSMESGRFCMCVFWESNWSLLTIFRLDLKLAVEVVWYFFVFHVLTSVLRKVLKRRIKSFPSQFYNLFTPYTP